MNRSLPPLLSHLALLLLLASLSIQAQATGRHVTKKKSHTQPATEATSQAVETNDFPTQARVEYVSQCMAEHGGTNLDNMYHCVCAIDKIAATMKFQEYSEALTFTYMYDTPGEKGGEFRDPPQSKQRRDRLKEAYQAADVCFPPAPDKVEEKPAVEPAKPQP